LEKYVKLFKKHEALSAETAVSLQEISDTWEVGGIKAFRASVVKGTLNALMNNGKVRITDNGKYYLAVRK
jgi:hypothetical protein